jgi:hypothetical protein
LGIAHRTSSVLLLKACVDLLCTSKTSGQNTWAKRADLWNRPWLSGMYQFDGNIDVCQEKQDNISHTAAQHDAIGEVFDALMS